MIHFPCNLWGQFKHFLGHGFTDVKSANGSVEELNRQLNAGQAEGDARVTALTEQVTSLTGERDTASTELATAQAELHKFRALQDFPELLPLADSIPNLPDAEMMKKHLETMKKGVELITTAKAEQLTAGMTPGPTTPANQVEYAYSNLSEWQAALNGAAGTAELIE